MSSVKPILLERNLETTHYFIHEMAVLKSFSKFFGRHMCGIVSLNLQAVSLLFLKKNSTVVVSAKSRYYIEKLFLLSGTG